MDNRHIKVVLLVSWLPAVFAFPAMAQSVVDSGASSGDQGNTTYYTGEGPAGVGGNYSYPTSTQRAVSVPTYLGRLAPAVPGTAGLPPCSLDSFVRNAGGMADMIYGDEGTDGPPPFYGFTENHRIEAGIFGERALGLTTGHASPLPSAWGSDEFLGAEWGGSFSSPASSTSSTSRQSQSSNGTNNDTRKIKGPQ